MDPLLSDGPPIPSTSSSAIMCEYMTSTPLLTKLLNPLVKHVIPVSHPISKNITNRCSKYVIPILSFCYIVVWGVWIHTVSGGACAAGIGDIPLRCALQSLAGHRG